MEKKILRRFLFVVFVGLMFSGCAHGNSPKPSAELIKNYGVDGNYFLGLQTHNQKQAVKYFQKALTSKNNLIARLSAKKLVEVSDKKNALTYAESFYKKFGDDESLAIYLKQLYENENYEKILELTKNLDISLCDDEVTFFICATLLEKKDPSFPGIFNLWCGTKNFTKFHKDIFDLIDAYPENEFAFASGLAKMKNYVFQKKYGTAISYSKDILLDSKNLKPSVVSDCGKSFLYSGGNYESNAGFLRSRLTGKNEIDFLLNFYAGRLYSKVETNVDDAKICLKKAMDCATTDEDYDNALWYYLTFVREKSLNEAVSETEFYCDKWHDKDYFDDYFDSLSVALLDEKKWETYFKLTNFIEGKSSPETFSKFSYTTASLMENNFYSPTDVDKNQLIKTYYEKALDGGRNSYHKLMAAAKLGLSDEETWSNFKILNKDENFEKDDDLEQLLMGYVDFDFPELAYDFWLDNSSKISLETSERLAEYFFEKTKDDANYYYKSLRVAAKKLNKSETDLTKKIFEYSFPKGFSDYVEDYCKEYGMEDYVLYSLIRKESFYLPSAVSYVGATGLCQIMDSTAGDIAKKLKIQDYDLSDAETSVKFGTFYLEELISRLDNALLGICSYNAGLGKIRSTYKSVAKQMNVNDLPVDIFLEMLAITETRNYGRDVVANAAIYAYLYENKSPALVAKELMGLD